LSNLGVQYFAGLGARKDADRAFACFQEGAELGNADAQASLAVCLADGIGTVIDLVAARRWAQLAVLNGNGRAGTILAQINELD
jgi:TPR repeat protein